MDESLVEAIMQMWYDGYSAETIADELFLEVEVVRDEISRKENR